jgi:hypothetical protein
MAAAVLGEGFAPGAEGQRLAAGVVGQGLVAGTAGLPFGPLGGLPVGLREEGAPAQGEAGGEEAVQEPQDSRLRNPWTADDITLLLNGIRDYGKKSWQQIADHLLPHRTAFSLSSRWSRLKTAARQADAHPDRPLTGGLTRELLARVRTLDA